MTKDITFSHALTKIGRPKLNEMLKTYTDEPRVNPNILKPELVETLSDLVPKDERIKIIDSVFNKPNSRYTAHFAQIADSLSLTDDEIKSKLSEYTSRSKFEGYEFEKSDKEQIEFMFEKDDEYTFIYTLLTRSPHYDPSSMTSNIVSYQKKVRVVVNNIKKRVIVFTGDRNMFTSVLTALTVSLGVLFKPLDANKTGISEATRKGFSFDTVKFIDFIYNGLSSIGIISEVYQVNLETSKSKKPQKVKVQGDMLLRDKNVCGYLYLYTRNIVGVRVDIKLNIRGHEYLISCDFEIRDDRIKIGIKKEKYSIEELRMFSGLIEDIFYNKVASPGLIDVVKTEEYLREISSTAIRKD